MLAFCTPDQFAHIDTYLDTLEKENIYNLLYYQSKLSKLLMLLKSPTQIF